MPGGQLDEVLEAEGFFPRMWRELINKSRRPVGTNAVMSGQLRHIIALVSKRRLVVQVLPFTSGAHALLEGSVTLMNFEDAPLVACSEGPMELADPRSTA